MSASEWFLTDGGGAPVWTLSDVDTPAVAAGAPGSVSASPTGGTTVRVEWTLGMGGLPDEFDVELESPTGSGTWVAAVGAANPVPGGTLLFDATGLTVVTSYTPRVRARKSGFPDSGWTTGAAVVTDNSGSGGGVIGAVDSTAPVLSGVIAITSLTSTGYIATCPAGSDAVGVTGYQWRLGGTGLWTDIPSGGRSATFSGRTPASSDSLEMRCRDAANFSAPLSTVVTLLGTAPVVTLQPVNVSMSVGGTAVFTAGFSGAPAPTLQWYRNGVAVPGAVGTTYSSVVALIDSGVVVFCRGTNGVGAPVDTNGAVLTVTSVAVAPNIITQPASQSVVEGAVVNFNVVAGGTAPLTYQWRRNGTPIGGATSAGYSFVASLADAGATFSVVVTNLVNSVTSSVVTLGVVPVGSQNPFDVEYPVFVPETSGPREVLRLSRSRGDTYGDVFVVKSGITGLPLDITGCSFLLTVDPDLAPANSDNNIIQLAGAILDASNGRVEFAPNAVQADHVGSFYFDMQLTDATGRKRTIKYGEYAFKQDITKN